MKKISLIVLLNIFGLTSFSQDASQFISPSDISDGENLIKAYFNPFTESLGGNLNNGWYNTAKPHNFGGFDITLTINAAIIPVSAKNFTIGSEFGNFTSNSTAASTIYGNDNSTDMIYLESNTNTELAFSLPGGFNIPALPTPMLQAGVGLIKNTAIDIRYMPTLNLSDIKTNLFGLGIKHDILQWIPVIGDAIPMSLSLQAGYTELNTELEIESQKISLSTKATTINIVASKKLLLITGYIGFGLNSSVTNFSTDANFNLSGINFENAIELEFKSDNKIRTNVGLRLNLTVITIHADYTFSEYPTATLGVGVSLR